MSTYHEDQMVIKGDNTIAKTRNRETTKGMSRRNFVRNASSELPSPLRGLPSKAARAGQMKRWRSPVARMGQLLSMLC
jgi:hypothetical protein